MSPIDSISTSSENVNTFSKKSENNPIRGTQNLINESRILYIDPQKNRTNAWLRRNRLQLPFGVTKVGSISKVAYSEDFVKYISKNNSSAYKRDTEKLITEAIAQENTGEIGVYFIKKEACKMIGARVQFPTRLQNVASNSIIHTFSEKVNMKDRHNADSFEYRTVYFRDYDGKYYIILLSVKKTGIRNEAYSLGKIRERTDLLKSMGSSDVTAGAQRSVLSKTVYPLLPKMSTLFQKKVEIIPKTQNSPTTNPRTAKKASLKNGMIIWNGSASRNSMSISQE